MLEPPSAAGEPPAHFYEASGNWTQTHATGAAIDVALSVDYSAKPIVSGEKAHVQLLVLSAEIRSVLHSAALYAA